MQNEFVTKLKSTIRGKTAVYIDAANLEQSVKNMWVNPKDIPDDLKSFTANELRWSLDYTKDHPHRKANFDVEIATDATFYMEKYATFILFSGDCDFAYLLKFLRGHGKKTLVFSRSGFVAKELPPACHSYFDIADFRNEIMRVNQKAKNPTPFGAGS